MTDRTKLEDFYDSWSTKSEKDIEHDLCAAERKADLIVTGLSSHLRHHIHSVLDFGCGFGRFLDILAKRLDLKHAFGVDFSADAIRIAKNINDKTRLEFQQLHTLSASENVQLIQTFAPEGIDCILLIDLLEHIPDCVELLSALSTITPLFLIKLPIESSILDNYLLPKEFPGSNHSNGHLREFNVNDVHYFVRQIGLTPIVENTYVYHIDDMFPPPAGRRSFKGVIYRNGLKWLKLFSSWILPKRIFLRLIGGGGYYCLATFDKDHVLHP